MKKGVCNIISQDLTAFDINKCKNISKGIVDESLLLSLSRSFEDLR
jgi:hypothetical protein